MRKVIAVAFMASLLFLSSCATLEDLSPGTKRGAAIGAVAGGILGAVVDSNRPWRGAVIGAAAGAAAGGWIGHTMDKDTGEPVVQADADVVNLAATEAASQNATVKYSRVTEEGINEEIVATPGEIVGNRQRITVEYFRDGVLISTEVKEVAV